ncbi:alpha-acetolactate decarboxylase [Micractinium conductrix]|uniref:Alpha-acetolactate decarboxylase n=1 Tax=Micractinium conductrix TaxID=554055 RepID=A0A2P6V879_9CHLO|nr:alpha-acetolactate decarboxylase [Micractinium conductrix]|eukprot:PSC70289.1 alpha-acetolactate decarboxylase [Micractinium conductrix]
MQASSRAFFSRCLPQRPSRLSASLAVRCSSNGASSSNGGGEQSRDDDAVFTDLKGKGFGRPKQQQQQQQQPTAASAADALQSTLAGLSAATGRVPQGNNVILDTTKDEDKWRELDLQVNEYPGQRTFKAIGTGDQDFVAAMTACVETVVGTVHAECVQQRLSAKGNYISVTVGPVINLVEGLLTDDVTIGEALQRCGDFGLGTLNKLDGEVVVLDGLAYQQGPTGAVRLVAREEKTPFMTLTRWRPDRARTMDFPTRIEHPELLAALEAQFASRNVFYAIRLVGSFESLRLRSVRKQAVDRPLVEVAEDQAVFELGPSSGVLVGFWSPAFIGSTLTVPGYHFHYLSDDRQRGGHVLHTVLLQGSAQIMELHHAVADMPRTEAYMGADLANDAAEALGKAE